MLKTTGAFLKLLNNGLSGLESEHNGQNHAGENHAQSRLTFHALMKIHENMDSMACGVGVLCRSILLIGLSQ